MVLTCNRSAGKRETQRSLVLTSQSALPTGWATGQWETISKITPEAVWLQRNNIQYWLLSSTHTCSYVHSTHMKSERHCLKRQNRGDTWAHNPKLASGLYTHAYICADTLSHKQTHMWLHIHAHTCMHTHLRLSYIIARYWTDLLSKFPHAVILEQAAWHLWASVSSTQIFHNMITWWLCGHWACIWYRQELCHLLHVLPVNKMYVCVFTYEQVCVMHVEARSEL